MGLSSSLPLSDSTKASIHGRTLEILRVFGMEFSKAYTQAVIKHAREDADHSLSLYGNGRMLHTAPLGTAVLKSGVLLKRGEVMKNWKQRYVVVHNEAENYRIDYFDGTSDANRLKGSIHCAGYFVHDFTKEECAEFGENGIKLVPRAPGRRKWFVRCGTDDKLRNEWFLAFTVACFKAKPPRDEDDCIGAAYESALLTVRWRFGIWGDFVDGGRQGERLADLVLDIIDKEYLNKLTSDISDPIRRASRTEQWHASLREDVLSSADNAWVSSVTAIRSVSDMIHVQVQRLIAPIVVNVKELKKEIGEVVRTQLRDFLAEKRVQVLEPIFAVIAVPFLEGFVTASKGFHAAIKEALTKGEFSSSNNGEVNLANISWQIDSWTHPLVRAADAQVCKIYTDSAYSQATMLYAGISPFILINTAVDRIASLLRRALFTFSTLAADIVESEHAEVLNHVMGLFLHDCALLVRTTLLDVLKTMIESSVQEDVLAPCQPMLAPLQDVIDSLEEPEGLSVLLDLDTMLEEVVKEAETMTLDAIVSDFLPQIQAAIASTSTELGVPLLTHTV